MSALNEPEALDSITPEEVEPLARRMAEAYWRALKAEAMGRVNGLRHAMRDKQDLLEASPANLEWRDLSYVEQLEPGSGFEVYDQIKQAARDDLESGQRAADVVASAMTRPWVKARFLALRESFIADWKPKGSIETRLIEMMAQLYTAYEHWMELSVQRVEFECQQETYQIKDRGGKWRAVSVNGDVEAHQAAEMADRYNRLFLRTLRQLRDLRRYSVPILINNPEQVNIAAEGGQQVNVQENKRNRKRGEKAAGSTGRRERKVATKSKPKQLGSKSSEESIRMKPARGKRQGAAPGLRRLRMAK
jgi:hypothetical protein